ncbi:MAG: hypothetical protein ACD_48C00122G0008 [uncultured bacterium]|nr:MAG: hypothetical protein ACD_48C00122G0008 [uncultured bacterium]
MLQKIIQVGNSLAVVLPKPFTKLANFKVGDYVSMETNEHIHAIYIRPKQYEDQPGFTPEFKIWLDDIASKEKDTIQALARV